MLWPFIEPLAVRQASRAYRADRARAFDESLPIQFCQHQRAERFSENGTPSNSPRALTLVRGAKHCLALVIQYTMHAQSGNIH